MKQVLLIIFLFVSFSYGQESTKHFCATETPDYNTAKATKIFSDNFQNTTEFAQILNGNQLIQIPVYFHIIRNDNGTEGDVSVSKIEDQLSYMNSAFSGSFGGDKTPFRFYIAEIGYHNNTQWFESQGGGQNEFNDEMKLALRKGGRNALNIYTVKQPTAVPSIEAYATEPWTHINIKPFLDGVTTKFTTINPDKFEINVHEVGHWLSLFHTFYLGCSENNDFIEDTPAEAVGGNCSTPERDSCPIRTGLDPIDNYMDYSLGCLSKFTQDQTERMISLFSVYRDESTRFALWAERPDYLYPRNFGNASDSLVINVFVKKSRLRQIVNFTIEGMPVGSTYSIPSIACSLKSSCVATLSIDIPTAVTTGEYLLNITGKSFLGSKTTQTLIRLEPSLDLFYEHNFPNEFFYLSPITDSQGNLLVLSRVNNVGLKLNSISSKGMLNWRTENALSNESKQLVLGKDDRIHVPAQGANLFAFNSEGEGVANFPVLTGTGEFALTNPVITDITSGDVYTSARRSNGFGEKPVTISKFNEQASIVWQKVFQDRATNTSAGSMVRSYSGNLYTFLFSGITECARLDKDTGTSLLKTIDVGSSRVGGDSNGVFTDNITDSIYKINAGCEKEINPVYMEKQSGFGLEFSTYARGYVYMITYPTPYNVENVRIASIGVGQGTFGYRKNYQIRPNDVLNPIGAVSDQFVYILGKDKADSDRQKLFILDKELKIISSLNTTNICNACRVTVSDSGNVFLIKMDGSSKIYSVN